MRWKLRTVVPVGVIVAGSLLVPSVAGATPASGSSSKGSTTEAASKKASSGSSTKKSSASSGAAAGKRTHIVRSGDTVVGIAKKYGVSANSVRAANGIVDDELYLGARIIIDPSAGGSTKSSGGTSSSSGSTGSSYTVKDGDTLSGIASRHGVSLSSLLSANKMKSSSLILPGDELTIPGKGGSSSKGSGSTSGSGPDLRCPVPGASFMNDWGFPRDGGGRFHEGTDLFAPTGTPIYAPASGSVTFGKNGLGGNTFTLTTASGWEIYGAHLSKAVGSSRTVKAGEVIGTVGSSGNAAGGDAHLHMGLKRVGGTAMNPYPSVKAACG